MPKKSLSGIDLRAPLLANGSAGTSGQILSSQGTTTNPVWIDNFSTSVSHPVKAAVSINKGQAVYISSADGTNMIASLASNNSELASSKVMGLLDATVAINGIANVVTEGLLSGLNTSTATAGDPVWLGTSGNLIYGALNKPVAPIHTVFIGVVTRANSNNGEIFVRPQNGFELDELHDVSMTGKQDGYVLSWNASSGLYTFIAPPSSGPKYTISETAPINPSAKDQWLDSSRGFTYVYYDDGTSSQWMQIGASNTTNPTYVDPLLLMGV